MMLDLTLTDGEREALAQHLWSSVDEALIDGRLFEQDCIALVEALAPLLLRAGAVKGIEASAAVVANAEPPEPDSHWYDATDKLPAAIRSLTPPSTEETT